MLAAETSPGRWSIRAFVAFVVLWTVFAITVASGQRGGDEFFDNLWLTVPFLAGYVAAVAAFVIGVVSIARARERSVTVIVVTILGLLVTTFGVLEVAFPH